MVVPGGAMDQSIYFVEWQVGMQVTWEVTNRHRRCNLALGWLGIV